MTYCSLDLAGCDCYDNRFTVEVMCFLTSIAGDLNVHIAHRQPLLAMLRTQAQERGQGRYFNDRLC